MASPAPLAAVSMLMSTAACRPEPAAATAGTAPAPLLAGPAVPRSVEVISCVDLPRGDPRSHNLSGLAWDARERTLFAISDREKLLTVLAARPGFAGFDLRPSIPLDIDIGVWDGEAVASMGDQFLVVANETQPAVFTVDRSGHGATRIELPAFSGVRNNLGLEGIGYVSTPEGRYVFAINEEAFEHDGPVSTSEHGTVVRILRHPLTGGIDLEVAYLTDPIFDDSGPGNNGVSDLAPLSFDRLVLIERAFVRGKGNAIRVYEVDLHDAQNIASLPDARVATPVRKRLVMDLTTLPDERCPAPPGPQPRKTLDNYEGIALGPLREDGTRVVFMITDDNRSAHQVPRLITVAIPSDLR